MLLLGGEKYLSIVMCGRCDLCAVKWDIDGPGTPNVAPKEKTRADRLFQVLCLIVGLQVHGKQKKWQNRLSKVAWFGVSILCVSPVLQEAFHVLVVQSGPVSLTVVIANLNYCLFTFANVFATFVFVSKREIVVPLLQKNGRKLEDVLCPLLRMAPNLISPAVCQSSGTENSEDLYARVSLAFGVAITTGFLLIVADVLIELSKLHQDLLSSIEVIGKGRPGSLVRKKWHLREQLQQSNDLFAWILSIFYFQVVLSAVLTLSLSLGESPQFDSYLLGLSALIGLTSQIWSLASKSSACLRMCDEAENLFSKFVDTNNTICRRCQVKHFRLLRYRDEWDAVKVACFTQSVPNFLRYMVTCITCVAVVLQFDFKVVGTLSELASKEK